MNVVCKSSSFDLKQYSVGPNYAEITLQECFTKEMQHLAEFRDDMCFSFVIFSKHHHVPHSILSMTSVMTG